MLRIGITQRIVHNTTYPEKRDALSSEWHLYVRSLFPEAVLVPLFNNPDYALHTFKSLKLNRLILSNGNDIESEPYRDRTEEVLLNYCRDHDIHVLGICRGFQFIQFFLKGHLEKNIQEVSGEDHVNKSHEIFLTLPYGLKPIQKLTTNSYHNQGIMDSSLAKELIPFAKTAHGVIEGFFHQDKPLIGIQWHPERKSPSKEFDDMLIKKFFTYGIFWK